MNLNDSVPVRHRIRDMPYTYAVPVAMFFSAINAAIYFDAVGVLASAMLVLLAIVGSLTVLVGLKWRGKAVVSYIIERTGQYLCLGAWLVNFYIIWFLAAPVFSFATPAIFFIATVLRIMILSGKINMIEEVQRAHINEVRGDEE